MAVGSITRAHFTQPVEIQDRPFGDFGMMPIIWSVPTTTNAVALTFDDGPDPAYTPQILDILEQFDAQGTFSMMGMNCETHPEIAAAVVDGGHEIANHSWSHLDLTSADASVVRSELVLGRTAIERVTGEKVTYFRPPRGVLTAAVVRAAAEDGQSILMWTVNGGLPGLQSPARIHDEVVGKVGPGHIICFHDGIGRGTFAPDAQFARELDERRRREIAALPRILSTLQDRGTKFLTAGQLISLGSTPVDGPAGETTPLPEPTSVDERLASPAVDDTGIEPG